MKDLKIYISIATVLLIIYVIAQYNRPKPTNWSESFSRKDKIPFGTYVLYERLTDIFPTSTVIPKREPAYITFTESTPFSGNYIVIGGSAKIDQYDFKYLKQYMEKGNNVLVASYYLGNYIQDSLRTKVSTELNFKNTSSPYVYFVNQKLNPNKRYRFDKSIGLQYFSGFDSARAVVLGKNHRGHVNFIKYRFGKGALYMLPSPFLFSNYNLLKPDGAEYAAKALSYLPVKKEIIWNEYAALGNEEETSLIGLFFKHKELSWAYYIALFSLILFVVYEVKRRQRIIPVIEPLANTSAEFAKVVGQVYYQQRDNGNIAQKQVIYFLEGIRTKYHIQTSTLDNEFAAKLENKSGVGSNLILALIGQIAQLKNYQKVSDQELIELNKNIEQFHQQAH